MFETTVTLQISLSSILSIKKRGDFQRFREAIGYLRTFNIFYSFSRIRKIKFRIIFLLNDLKDFVTLKWLKKRFLNFGSFHL